MKVEELRVGNVTKQGQIKSFIGGGVHFGFGKCCYFSELAPIPLTEDILLKCGFVAESKYDDFKLNGVKIKSWSMLSKNLEGYNFYLNLGLANDGLNNKVDSLHELQNLYYALTKEELDVSGILK